MGQGKAQELRVFFALKRLCIFRSPCDKLTSRETGSVLFEPSQCVGVKALNGKRSAIAVKQLRGGAADSLKLFLGVGLYLYDKRHSAVDSLKDLGEQGDLVLRVEKREPLYLL